jgi:hypothetical protein
MQYTSKLDLIFPFVFVGSLQSRILLYSEHWHYYGQSILMPVELARMPTALFVCLNAHRTGFYECVLSCFQCFDLTLPQLFKQGKGRQAVILVLAKTRQRATLPPKSDENGLFFEKQIAKLRQF